MPITQSYPHAKFSFQINWALQHMIKMHNCDEGPSSLLKISLSEKENQLFVQLIYALQHVFRFILSEQNLDDFDHIYQNVLNLPLLPAASSWQIKLLVRSRDVTTLVSYFRPFIVYTFTCFWGVRVLLNMHVVCMFLYCAAKRGSEGIRWFKGAKPESFSWYHPEA
jgi:hypothetical protein